MESGESSDTVLLHGNVDKTKIISYSDRLKLPYPIILVLLFILLTAIGWFPLNINSLKILCVVSDPENDTHFAQFVQQFSVSSVKEVQLQQVLKHELWSSVAQIQFLAMIDNLLENDSNKSLAVVYLFIVGFSTWMFSLVIADYICTLGTLGRNVCALLGPLFFVFSLFCIFRAAYFPVLFLGLLFLSLSFHCIYRSAIAYCYSLNHKNSVIISIIIISITADLCGILPFYILRITLYDGTLGRSTLRSIFFHSGCGIAVIGFFLLVGIIPGLSDSTHSNIDFYSNNEKFVHIRTISNDIKEKGFCSLGHDGDTDSVLRQQQNKKRVESNLSYNSFQSHTIIAPHDDTPFLSSVTSLPLPELKIRSEGNNGSICYLEYRVTPEVQQLNKLGDAYKQLVAMKTIKGRIEWVFRLYNCLATTHVLSWLIQMSFLQKDKNQYNHYFSVWLFELILFFCWVPGLLVFMLWMYAGFTFVRACQTLSIMVSLILFSFPQFSIRLCGMILFLSFRSLSYGSVDLAAKYVDKYQSQCGSSVSRTSPNEYLIPILNLFFIPCTQCVIYFFSKKSPDGYIDRNGLAWSTINPSLILVMNIIWVISGVCVLLGALGVYIWFCSAFHQEFYHNKTNYRRQFFRIPSSEC